MNSNPLFLPRHGSTRTQNPEYTGQLAAAKVGEYAPAFVLPRCDGGYFGFAELIGRPSILHFYPSAAASWSRQSACLNALALTLEMLGVRLVGIVCACREIAAYHCNEAQTVFPILCDWEPIGLVSRLYGLNSSRVSPDFPATSYLMDSRGVIKWTSSELPSERGDPTAIINAVKALLSFPAPLESCD